MMNKEEQFKAIEMLSEIQDKLNYNACITLLKNDEVIGVFNNNIEITYKIIYSKLFNEYILYMNYKNIQIGRFYFDKVA